MRSRGLWLGLGLVALAAVFLLGERGGERRPAEVESPADVAARGGPEVAHQGEEPRTSVAGGRTARPVEMPEGLPRSLGGTAVDGALVVDEHGRFVPTPDAIALFDYFLAASGEEAASRIEQRIRAEIAARLGPGEAAISAGRLLDQYLGLREELRELVEAGVPPHDLERRLQWIRELRRAHFGEETAQALFGEHESVLAIDLARRRVAGDPAMSDVEKQAELAALEAQLPEQVREARQRAAEPARSRREVARLRSDGASDAEVYEARAREFGDEAAARLATLDAERARWQERLAVYREERDALVLDAEAEGREAEPDLAALRARHFDAQEQLRVRAMDVREH